MSWLGVFGAARRARTAAEIEAEVRAELEHHLACKERELVEQGCTAEAARAEARRSFGDLEATRRACLRLQLRRASMLQRLHLAVTVALFAGVLFLGWNYLDFRRAVAELARIQAEREAALLRMEEWRKHPPEDPLAIRVGNVLEVTEESGLLSLTLEVEPDGAIELPGTGRVVVRGLIPDEAAQVVYDALKPGLPRSLGIDVRVRVIASAERSEKTAERLVMKRGHEVQVVDLQNPRVSIVVAEVDGVTAEESAMAAAQVGSGLPDSAVGADLWEITDKDRTFRTLFFNAF